MSKPSQIPQELITKIFWDLSLKDCRSFILAIDCEGNNTGFDPMTARTALTDRESINIYLGHFFPNPSELLARMRVYSVWIIGSFALNYFSGHFRDETPTINFVVPCHQRMVINFMECMRRMGVEWKDSDESLVFVYGSMQHQNIKLNIELSTGSRGFRDMLDNIVRLDLSILQCAITGYSAFHMYASDVYDKQASMWGFEHDCTWSYMLSDELIQKYKDLGYKMIIGSRYLPSTATLKQLRVSRTIGGIGSEILTFPESWLCESAKYERSELDTYIWDEYPSFLRRHSTYHHETHVKLVAFRDRMEEYFMKHQQTISSDTINKLTDKYYDLEIAVNLCPALSLDKKSEYDLIDEEYYTQFKIVQAFKHG